MELLSKCFLGLDILGGLNFLHIHGITHCDLKPANILISVDDTITLEMQRSGRKPIVAKICDFGNAVIHADYKRDAPFQARMGSFPWASPELEHPPSGLPIEIRLLPNADIYSFGLVLASIFMNGATPFNGLSPEQVTSLKISGDEENACKHVSGEVKAVITISPLHESFINLLLLLTLLPDPEQRLPIEKLMALMKLQVILMLHEDPEQPPSSSREDRSLMSEGPT